MANENIGFDLSAFKLAVEGSVVRSLLNVPGADEATRDMLYKTLAVFEKHGIGAMTAIQIMADLSNALDK